MLDIALEVPLGALSLIGLVKCNHFDDSRIGSLDDPLNGAALSGGVLGTEYRDVFAFAILILVLLVRPAGILGEPVSEESMVYKREF